MIPHSQRVAKQYTGALIGELGLVFAVIAQISQDSFSIYRAARCKHAPQRVFEFFYAADGGKGVGWGGGVPGSKRMLCRNRSAGRYLKGKEESLSDSRIVVMGERVTQNSRGHFHNQYSIPPIKGNSKGNPTD